MEHMGIRGFSIINHPAIGVPPIWEILIWLVVTGTMEFVWLSIYIYICIGNVISSQLTFTPSFFRAIPPTSQPVIIQVLPSQIHFFSRCFNGVQPCSTTRPWVFPTIPGDGGERLRTLLMDQPWGNVAVFTPGNTWVWVGIKSNWLMYFQDMIIIWMWIKMEDLKLDQRF